MTANEIVRKRIIDGILERMTDQEMRDYLILSTISREHDEVMNAINEQGKQIDIISRKNSWLYDFSANISANAVFNTLLYLGSRLIQNIK